MWNFGIEGHVGGGVWYADVACTDYKNYICKSKSILIQRIERECGSIVYNLYTHYEMTMCT